MFRAMALKEFREIRGIALIALLLFCWFVLHAMNTAFSMNFLPTFFSSPLGYGEVPFINDSFTGKFCWLAAGLAIALGLRQTIGESVRGTYPFLFHRPAERRWLIGVKLLVGAGVYLICAVVPLAIYCLWAATPGTHASPFQWSMTWPSWLGWFVMMTFYFGAFLTGIQPGRWYRRLLSLAAAVIPVVIPLAIASQLDWGLVSWLIPAAFDAWLIAMILFVARTRDYS